MSRRAGQVSKKFTGDVRDPLEIEATLKEMKPTPEQEQKDLLEICELLENDPNVTEEEKRAIVIWKTNLRAEMLKPHVQKQFVSSFWSWLLGRGTAEEIKKTAWGRESLADDLEVSKYVTLFVNKMQEYRVKLFLLGNRRPIGINECYLYYKYIVRGEGSPDGFDPAFLKDWVEFGNDFDRAREAGQEYRRPMGQAHEMAPYDDVADELAETRAASRKMPPDWNGTGRPGPPPPAPPPPGPPPPRPGPDAPRDGVTGTGPAPFGGPGQAEEAATEEDDEISPDDFRSAITDLSAEFRAMTDALREFMAKPQTITNTPGNPPPPPPGNRTVADDKGKEEEERPSAKVAPVPSGKRFDADATSENPSIKATLAEERVAKLEIEAGSRIRQLEQSLTATQTRMAELESRGASSRREVLQLQQERDTLKGAVDTAQAEQRQLLQLANEATEARIREKQQAAETIKQITDGKEQWTRDTQHFITQQLEAIRGGYVQNLEQLQQNMSQIEQAAAARAQKDAQGIATIKDQAAHERQEFERFRTEERARAMKMLAYVLQQQNGQLAPGVGQFHREHVVAPRLEAKQEQQKLIEATNAMPVETVQEMLLERPVHAPHPKAAEIKSLQGRAVELPIYQVPDRVSEPVEVAKAAPKLKQLEPKAPRHSKGRESRSKARERMGPIVTDVTEKFAVEQRAVAEKLTNKAKEAKQQQLLLQNSARDAAANSERANVLRSVIPGMEDEDAATAREVLRQEAEEEVEQEELYDARKRKLEEVLTITSREQVDHEKETERRIQEESARFASLATVHSANASIATETKAELEEDSRNVRQAIDIQIRENAAKAKADTDEYQSLLAEAESMARLHAAEEEAAARDLAARDEEEAKNAEQFLDEEAAALYMANKAAELQKRETAKQQRREFLQARMAKVKEAAVSKNMEIVASTEASRQVENQLRNEEMQLAESVEEANTERQQEQALAHEATKAAVIVPQQMELQKAKRTQPSRAAKTRISYAGLQAPESRGKATKSSDMKPVRNAPTGSGVGVTAEPSRSGGSRAASEEPSNVVTRAGKGKEEQEEVAEPAPNKRDRENREEEIVPPIMEADDEMTEGEDDELEQAQKKHGHE